MKRTVLLTVLLFAFLFNPYESHSQKLILHQIPLDAFEVHFDYTLPNMKIQDLSLPSGIYNFGIHFPVARYTSFVASIPFSIYAYEFTGYDDFGITNKKEETYSAFGNLYMGFKTRLGKARKGRLDVGLYLPTAQNKDNSSYVNYLSYFSDMHNLYKYASKATSIFCNYRYKETTDKFLIYGASFGNGIFIPIDDEDNRDIEDFVHYSAFFGYEKPNVFGAELKLGGIFALTEDDIDLNKRALHALDINLYYPGEQYKFGAFFRMPIEDEWSDRLENAFGITFTYRAKKARIGNPSRTR